ncbi:BRO-N domain-containing protein [Azospirillum melinis]
MTNVHSFVFPASAGPISIRTAEINEAPWFVAKEVCRCLGLNNATLALRPLADDEKGFNRIDTPGGSQSLYTLTESGLYKLVMRSDKPEARKFQDWVTRDVLPAIRKDGGYIMGEEKVITGALRDSLHRPHHCPLPM